MLGTAEMFTFFFVMLGPLKVLAPFAHRTQGLSDATVRQIAWRAFLIATTAVLGGGLLGTMMLTNWRISNAALTLAAGVVFFLVALRQLLEQYEPPAHATPETLPAVPMVAASRLVFPVLVTPYGIAAVIALLAGSAQSERTITILGLVLVIMLLNLVAMLYARRILVGFAVIVLQVVGAVLAILQVALSIQFIILGFQQVGILPQAP